ncbi:hypothetical protein D9599_25760 [Roseomonas sp. KE2513]|uniref:hypothetical protein n=1 Tax=Roseomonas sp. KE2513 TaxID=2479202 RepID=UPI0018DF9653|nr:hypothetical protein [Roseomonas sp. KE2513]MBI0538964.1 hypothetical protein [Roseomonas sp. KE2513]
MHTIALPFGTAAKLHIVPEPQASASGTPFAVVVARSDELTTPTAFTKALTAPGALTAVLTHYRGMSWTDRTGEMLLVATLDRGGIVLMSFATLADAMGCRAKLRKLIGGAV